MTTMPSNKGNSQEEIKNGSTFSAIDGPSADLRIRLDAALESSGRFLKRGLYAAALDECYAAIGLLPTFLPIN